MPRFLSAGLYHCPVMIEYRPDEGIELYLKTIDLNTNHSLAHLILHYRDSCTMGGAHSIRIRMKCGEQAAEVTKVMQFITGKVKFDGKIPASGGQRQG